MPQPASVLAWRAIRCALLRVKVDVIVLEKHADFLRDFRGDTVHPSTLDVMADLGLLDAFLARPHDKARVLRATISGQRITLADFTRLRTRCGFIAMVPQWEFLDFLRDEAERHASFHLMLEAEATGLDQRDGRVVGVQVRMRRPGQGAVRIAADPAVPPDAITPLLARVQQRRLFPARVTQAVQVAIQNRLLTPVLAASGRGRPCGVPWPLRWMQRFPALQVLPAYAVGVGVRPERVR